MVHFYLEFEGNNEKLQHKGGRTFVFNLRYPYSKNLLSICCHWKMTTGVTKTENPIPFTNWVTLLLPHFLGLPFSLSLSFFSISISSYFSSPSYKTPLILGYPFKIQNFSFFIMKRNAFFLWKVYFLHSKRRCSFPKTIKPPDFNMNYSRLLKGQSWVAHVHFK